MAHIIAASCSPLQWALLHYTPNRVGYPPIQRLPSRLPPNILKKNSTADELGLGRVARSLQ